MTSDHPFSLPWCPPRPPPPPCSGLNRVRFPSRTILIWLFWRLLTASNNPKQLKKGRKKDDACRLYAARCSASNSLLLVQGLTHYLSIRYRFAPSALRFTLHDHCSHADKVRYFPQISFIIPPNKHAIWSCMKPITFVKFKSIHWSIFLPVAHQTPGCLQDNLPRRKLLLSCNTRPPFDTFTKAYRHDIVYNAKKISNLFI